MVKPIDPHELAHITRDYAAGYLSTPVTTKRSLRAVWWSMCRELGRQIVRSVFRGLR